MDLSGTWELLQKDRAIAELTELEGEVIQATVPNSVQWSVFESGELPHPYHHQNVYQYEYIDKKVWYYKKEFDTPANASGNYNFLVFDGIDYFARIWLNGNYIGEHEGMFGGPSVEISSLLNSNGRNTLIVEVRAGTHGEGDVWKDRNNKGRVVQPWVFAYAKLFNPLGIWQPVRIETVPKVHLERPFLKTLSCSEDEAELSLTAEVFVNDHSLNYQMNTWENKIIHDVPNARTTKIYSQPVSLTIELIEKETGKQAFQQNIELNLREGKNWIDEKLTVRNPKLWWPNGMGEANCYTVKLSLRDQGKDLDEIQFTTGIRKINHLKSAGPQVTERWVNWQFEVNGKKFFVKGMNWMPGDILLHLPDEDYRWWIDMAKNQGIQLIRVWGGGLVEPESFYKYCNQAGIMVWQDFPMGNSEHDNWSQEVWQSTVATNIFRLRNHPSLAVYCGGNEFNPYSLGNSTMTGIVEGLCTDLDGTRLFLRSTPDRGSEHTYPDMDPTWYQYEYALVPYMAETGIHNFADARTFREEVSEEELKRPIQNIFDESFKTQYPEIYTHFTEYSPRRIPRMLSRASQIIDISEPLIDDLAEASQVGAGEFYQIFSEVLQANYPVTTGLMPWVFKRPWTLVAIQNVDATGQPTAPYYYMKRTYEPTHVMVQLPHLMWAAGEKIPIQAKVIHSPDKPLEGLKLSVKIYDAKFQEKYSQSSSVNLQSGPSVAVKDLVSFTIPESMNESFFFIVAELMDGQGQKISQSVYWPRCLDRMGDEQFRNEYRSEPKPALTFDKEPRLKDQMAKTKTNLSLTVLSESELRDNRNSIRVEIENKGKHPAWPLRIDVDGAKRSFFADDNYFWLKPGEKREIELHINWREAVDGKSLSVTVDAWNAKTKSETMILK